MSRSFDLLVIGDVNPDVVVGPVPRAMAFGQREQLVERGGLVLGGSAAIMACGAARLGLRVAFAGRVGDDPAGAFVRGALADRGVDVTHLATDPHLPTPLTVVLNDKDGDRAILTSPGCLTATSAQDVPEALLADARHVHAASFFLMPRLARSLAAVFATARSHGASTSLDTNDDPDGGWDRELLDPVLEFTDILLPNAAEARALTGETQLGRGSSRVGGTRPAGRRQGRLRGRARPRRRTGPCAYRPCRWSRSTPWAPATASTPVSSRRPCAGWTCARPLRWPPSAVRSRPAATAVRPRSRRGTRPCAHTDLESRT